MLLREGQVNKMSFVFEKVGEKNKELWESIGFRSWSKKHLDFI